MSMSKPSIRPVTGLRAPSSRVSDETPAMSRPRFLILSMVLPAGIASGSGIVAGGEYDCRQLVVATSVPDGAGEGVVVALGDGAGRGRRGVQRRRVVGARGGAGTGDQGGGHGDEHREHAGRVGLAAAHRYSSSRMRHAPPGAQGRDHPGQQPEHAGERQPPAGAVELLRGLVAQRRQLLVGGGVERGEGGVAGARRPGRWPARPRPPSRRRRRGRGSSGARRRRRLHGSGSRVADAGPPLELAELGGHRPWPRPARPSRTTPRSRGR